MRMKCNKVLSALLAILMVLGSFASLAYAVFADETDASTDTAQGSETTGDPDNSDTDTGDGTDSDDSGDTPKVDYLNRKFASAEEKIASMELKLERYGYQLYYDYDCTQPMDWIDVGQIKLTVYVTIDPAK